MSNKPNTAPVMNVPAPAPEQPAPALDMAALVAQFAANPELLAQFVGKLDSGTVKAALKTAETNKPTMLSVTMDCIVNASMTGDGGLITDNVAKSVTDKAREHGLLKADESCTQSSVAQLIRHVQAYDAALKRYADAHPAESADADAADATGDAGQAGTLVGATVDVPAAA